MQGSWQWQSRCMSHTTGQLHLIKKTLNLEQVSLSKGHCDGHQVV